MARNSTFSSKNLDARPYQLHLLKVERRGMRPMAHTVLNGNISKKAKIAAISGVAAMLVSLNGTSNAYAERLNLGPSSAAHSSEVLKNAVSCCDLIAKSVSVGAPESVVASKVTELFSLIDAEHQRLEAFAEKLGARLINVPSRLLPEDDENASDPGGEGEKTNIFWLRQNVESEGKPSPF